MAQTYTLDEAANRLGMPAEEFKRRLKDEWKSIRSFRDGATLRFRSADIDELARSLGQASDPGLQMGPPGAPPQTGSSDEFLLADPPRGGPDGSPLDEDSALGTEGIFSLAAGDSGKTKKKPGDSDVRLEVSSGPVADPDNAHPTEEIALDLSGAGSSALKAGKSSSKLKAPKSGPNLGGPGSGNKIPGPPPSQAEPASTDSSSEFELSLDADSGSFELQMASDSSEDEVPIGGETTTARPGSQSGINLAKPADSGVSLEKKGSAIEDDSDDFELSLDPSDSGFSSEISAAKGSGKIPVQQGDSDSEFELTLDDDSGVADKLPSDSQDDVRGDIFETDFELPAVPDDADSGSEVVAIESSDTDLENSDFDLALDEADAPASDESESQVVVLDDESDEGPPSGRRTAAVAGAAAGAAATRTRRPPADEDEDEDSASTALRDVRRRDEEEEEVAARPAAPARWSGWFLAPLGLTFVISFLGAIMAFELVNGMWGYHHGTQPGGTIVRVVAGMLDMDPKD